MYCGEYINDRYVGKNETPSNRVFNPDFFPDEDRALCDTEFESTVSAEERVVSPGSESSYWIAHALDPRPENLFDTFVDRLQLLHGAQILGTYHHRKNRVCSFGIAVRYRNHSEKLEDIAPQYPRAATSRHAINAENLLKMYNGDLQRINAAAIINYFDGEHTPFPDLEKHVKQFQTDTDDTFRLLLDIATSRNGDCDPMVEVFNPRSSRRAQILKGHSCPRSSIQRISKFFDHIGGIPPKRNI